MPDLAIAFTSSFGSVSIVLTIVLIAMAIRGAIKRHRHRAWWKEAGRDDE